VGNSYIATAIKTLDPGQSYQAQSKTTQVVGGRGNVTQVQNYNYGNLTTPARTYNYTYADASGYTSKYIYNLLTLATVTDGTSTPTLATNTYDSIGNLKTANTLTDTQSYNYDTKGNVTSMVVNGVAITQNFNSSTNYAVPSQLSVGSLTTNLSYNSFLGLTNETGPNGDSTSISWLSAGLPSCTTSPFGATTCNGYSGSVVVSQTVGNQGAGGDGRWMRSTLDGLGRPILTESGTLNGTTLSQAETVYDSCGCSPLGKMVKQAMPHAVGVTPVWTTYTYDGIGRTLSVQLPDGASTTTYVYQGNTVTVTDPAGKWKKFSVDALGNLTQVIEPDPTRSLSENPAKSREQSERNRHIMFYVKGLPGLPS
jgi:YD repeat-containing protein